MLRACALSKCQLCSFTCCLCWCHLSGSETTFACLQVCHGARKSGTACRHLHSVESSAAQPSHVTLSVSYISVAAPPHPVRRWSPTKQWVHDSLAKGGAHCAAVGSAWPSAVQYRDMGCTAEPPKQHVSLHGAACQAPAQECRAKCQGFARDLLMTMHE